MAPLALFPVSLFIALLGGVVLVYQICREVSWSFLVPQEKGYLLNIVKGAWNDTSWGFILPFTILSVFVEDLKPQPKQEP